MAIKFLNSVNADSGVLYVDADNNRVGIGTTNPAYKLTVAGRVSVENDILHVVSSSPTLLFSVPGGGIDSKIYNDGSGNFIIGHGSNSDNPAEKFRISSDGKLKLSSYGSGTNTGTATYALSVDANGNIIEGTVQSNPAGVDGTGTVDYLTKWLDGDTLTDSNVYEASGDLVTTLNLKSSSSYPQLKLTDTDNSSTSSIRSAGGSLQHVLHDATKSHVFYAGTTATELLRVTGDGKVGIGESNPTTKLHVYDATATAGISIQGSNAHSSDLNLGDTDDINIGRIKYDHTNDSMQFHTNNVERMRISSAGNLQLTAYTAGYLKSDASGNITVDTSIIEDTLDSVTDRDATTTNAITVGGLTVDTDTLHVDATNNRVGIGTTSPIAALHINNFNVPQLLLDGGGDSTGDIVVPSGEILQIGHWNTSLSSYTDRFRIVQNGDVGINTTSPDQKLHVTGNVRVTGAYYDSNNSPGLSGQILSSTATGTDWVSLSEIQGVDGTGTANYLAKWSDIDTITDSVVYDNGTNVGIGTSSPATKLHITGDITGTNKVLIENTNNGTNSYAGLGFQSDFGHTYHPGILLNSSTNTAYGGVDSLNIWQYHSKPITLVTNNVVRAIVTGGGNVGIGTTSPDTKLHVNVASTANYVINANDRLKVKGDGTLWWGSAADYGKLTWDTGKAIVRGESGKALSFGVDGGQDDMYINTSGNVGIGTTTPSSTLTVNGAIEILKDDVSSTSEGGHLTLRAASDAAYIYRYNIDNYSDKLRFFREDDTTGSNGVVFMQFESNGDLRLNQYTTGVLVTDANGNVSASTDYHTQETADARYVNVTGDTMTGGLNIEVSTSNTQLKLKRTTTATGEFNIYTNTDSLYFHNVGQSTYPMMINSSGNVGIGTTNPVRELHLHSASNTQMQFTDNGTGSNDTDGLRIGWNGSVGQMYLFEDADIRFATNDSEKVRITSAGNLGIGTSNPSGKLHSYISATRQMGHNAIGGDLGVISDNNSAPVLYVKGTGTADLVNVFDNTTNVFTIKDGGNVGIGTTSPDDKLSVTGNAGLYGSVSGGIVSPASLKFYTSENNAGLGDSVDSNKQNIGQITWTGKDGSLNTVGEYAAIRSYVIDSNNLIQGSAGEGGQIELSTFRHDVSTETRVEKVALTISPLGLLSFPQYGAGYVKSDASGNLTVDNSTFLQEEVDTLASVTSRGNTTSQTTFFNGTVNIGASVGMTFSSSSEGATYTPTESTVGTSRYFLRFDTTNDASFPYLTNRTPSGAVVIKTGTAAGGAENEHFRIKGGDGVVDAYFTNANVGIGTASPGSTLHVDGTVRFVNSGFAGFEAHNTNGTWESFIGTETGGGGNRYNSASSQHTFYNSSSAVMRINSSGNVGIGTTNPDYKLHVVGSSATVAKLYSTGFTNLDIVSTRTSGNLGGIRYQQSADTYISVELNGVVDGGLEIKTGDGSAAPSLNMKIDASGNLRLPAYGAGYLKTDASGNVTLDTVTSVVDGTGTASYIPKWSDSDTLTDSIIYDDGTGIGIGTTVPQGVLSVNKEDAMSSVVVSRGGTNLSASTAIGSLSFKADYADSPTDYANIYAYANAISGVRSSMDFNVKSSSGNILTAMTAYGSNTGTRIGIGTNAPSHKLTIDTGTNDFYIDEDTNINQGTGSSDQPAIYADNIIRIRQAVEIWDDNDGNNYLDIRDGSTQAIKLTPDGDSWITHDLGIGTTSPSEALHIYRNAASAEIRLQNNTISSYIRSSTDNLNFYVSNGEKVRITSGGNVGIGETNPSKKLHIRHDDNAPTGLLIQNLLDNNGTGDGDAAAEVWLTAASNNGYFRVHGAPTDVAAEHEIELGSTANSSFFTFKPSGNERMRIHNDGTIQLNSYGAGFIKSDASGNLSVDTATYVTSDNGEGIYSFNDTVDASTSEDIFSISNDHGAQSFRVTFVCNTSGMSVAKTFEVVHGFSKDPVFFKVVDTGAYNSSSEDHDFDVSFTNSNSNTGVTCSITNNSTTINADIVTTVFLGGSPTAITVTAL